MNIKEIEKGVFFVGVNDMTGRSLGGFAPSPYGVSHNSYIVKGEKVALIDYVAIERFDKSHNEVMSDIAPDYLVLNHVASVGLGVALKMLREKYQSMKIVGNAITLDMLKGYYGVCDNLVEVRDNDVIELGGKTLRFRLTPMSHWPETMMTYLEERMMLFTGDMFGTFGALNGGVVDVEIDAEPHLYEIYRYYGNVVGVCGKAVQRAVSKISDLDIDYMCPAHGPVWYEEIERVVSAYNRLSRQSVNIAWQTNGMTWGANQDTSIESNSAIEPACRREPVENMTEKSVLEPA